VQITRAQSLLVCVGNPEVWMLDPNWRQLLQYAVDHGAYYSSDGVPCPLTATGLGLGLHATTCPKTIVEDKPVTDSLAKSSGCLHGTAGTQTLDGADDAVAGTVCNARADGAIHTDLVADAGNSDHLAEIHQRLSDVRSFREREGAWRLML
jgi:hypothetical protein